MSDPQGDGAQGLDLARLGSCVAQRTDKVWRQFCVAQARVVVARRREATTQRIFLIGGEAEQR